MKSRGLLICLVIGLLMVLCIPHFSLAAMRTMDLYELTNGADLIVTGTVTNIESRSEQGIFTFFKIKVKQNIKGAAPQEVIVKVSGGEVNGIGLLVSDMPKFKLGEEVTVFLKKNGDYYIIPGLYQGKYTTINNIIRENNLPLDTFVSQIKANMQKPVPVLDLIK